MTNAPTHLARTSATPILVLASFLLALAYGWLGPGWREAGVGVGVLAALKASGIVVLALLATTHRRPLLATALLFGATGDVLLALGGDAFIYGAGAFLVGHVLYITLFLRVGGGFSALRREPGRLFAMGVVAIPAVALNSMLVPADSALFAPLLVYTLVLVAMTLSTFTLPITAWLAMGGGVLFLVSDGFVAAHLFHSDDPLVASFWFGFAGWMLYWAGQAGLCLGGLTLAKRA